MLGTLIFVTILSCYLFKENLYNFLKGISALFSKKMFIYFFLYEFNKKMEKHIYKETELIFNFVIKNRANKLYNKLTIFNTTYSVDQNKSLRIKIHRKNLLKSDIIDNITLSNSNTSKSFLISINLRQENYYQLFLDCLKKTNATEIVFYSKDNNIPNNLSAGYSIIKNYEKTFIPRIKRFYAINIDVNDVKSFYNSYASNKLEKKTQIKTDLFINLIKNKNKIIGRIFEQKEEEAIINFNNKEMKFLKEFENEILKKKLFPFFKSLNNKINSQKRNDIFNSYKMFLSSNKNNDIKCNIIEKMNDICFFIKYYDEEPKIEEINAIESIIFLNFLDDNNVINAYKYLEQKKKIFNNPFEFTLKEKLFLSLNIYLNIYQNIDAKLMKLYSLPKISPYVQSELIYKDVIMNLTYDSSLYFLYLQLNSNWDFDIISYNFWFKIKKISLTEIQNHLLSDFSPYFFTFNSKDSVAFTNPQTLLKSYNENEKIGYLYFGNFADTMSIDNTIKLFYIKIHEGSHCKFKGGFNIKKSGRYLLNYDLKVIDCHLDSIKYDITHQYSGLGENIGEEGYEAEIYIFGNYKTSDKLLSSRESLESLSNIKLYTGSNFDNLRKEILTKISNEDSMILNENFDNLKDIKNEKKKNENKNNEKEIGLMGIFLKSLEDGIH